MTSELYKNLLLRKEEEIREQLSWLLERNILVIHETAPKYNVDGNEIIISQRIGLMVETEQYINRLETEIVSLKLELDRHKIAIHQLRGCLSHYQTLPIWNEYD